MSQYCTYSHVLLILTIVYSWIFRRVILIQHWKVVPRNSKCSTLNVSMISLNHQCYCCTSCKIASIFLNKPTTVIISHYVVLAIDSLCCPLAVVFISYYGELYNSIISHFHCRMIILGVCISSKVWLAKQPRWSQGEKRKKIFWTTAEKRNGRLSQYSCQVAVISCYPLKSSDVHIALNISLCSLLYAWLTMYTSCTT